MNKKQIRKALCLFSVCLALTAGTVFLSSCGKEAEPEEEVTQAESENETKNTENEEKEQSVVKNELGYIVISPKEGDRSAEIQKIINENPNQTIFFQNGTYNLSRPIKTPADPTKSVSLRLAEFAVLRADTVWKMQGAVVQLGATEPANDTHTPGSNYSFEGGIIDGSGVADGISINGGRETAIRNVSIKNAVVGVHVLYGANSGSSDADISSLNIIGNGTNDSIGLLVEGFDNTFTNIRIGFVQKGVVLKSGGNMLRNIHPLYYGSYDKYTESCGFVDENGDNWFDYCYSDQFGIGFRTTTNGNSVFRNCFCYWWSPNGETQTAFRADKKFNSNVTDFKASFRSDRKNNFLLTCGQAGGTGFFRDLITNESLIEPDDHKDYIR